MSNVNRKFTLAARPVGYPKPSDFDLVTEPIPTPNDGEVLVRTNYLSVDPYMRGRMNDRASYAPNVQIGEAMVGSVVGEVVASKHSDFQVGDFATGGLGWQEYGVSDGSNLRKVDPTLAPISTALGILGMPGLTAYFGLLEICNPQPGETVFVSAAAGAVGSLVGQIAKIKGCRAVGSAGSAEKVDYVVNELGFDAAFDYKTTEDYGEKLTEQCPDGIDVYFDNVGGAITDAVFPLINVKARVSICGQISQYNLEDPEQGPRFLWHLIVKRAKIEGFLVFEFVDKHDDGLREMAEWIQEGKLKYREEIAEGFENAPAAFIAAISASNWSKLPSTQSHKFWNYYI